jgi:hypothetical protein
MSGHLLNTTSSLQCPHGGTVQIVSSNVRVKAGGAFTAQATDTFIIAGCPFQIPATPPIPSPCLTVRWLVTNLRTKANSAAMLSESCAGLCLSAAQVPQGPVTIVNTQVRASGQ